MHVSAVALAVQALSLLAAAFAPEGPPPERPPPGVGCGEEPVAMLGVPGDPREGRLAWQLEVERGGRRAAARAPRSSPSGLAPGRVADGYLPAAGEGAKAAAGSPGELYLVLPDAGALVWVDDRLVPGEGRTRQIELAVPAQGRTVRVRAAWQAAGGLMMEERWVGVQYQKVTCVGLTGERARRVGR